MFQFYRNPVPGPTYQGPGAYRHSCMLLPSANEVEGFMDLIVKHDYSKLYWEYDPDLPTGPGGRCGAWRVNQDALIAPAGSSASGHVQDQDFWRGATPMSLTRGDGCSATMPQLV